jgi:hypothetical protein
MKKVKNIPTYYTFPGTKIFRDTTALPFPNGGILGTISNYLNPMNWGVSDYSSQPSFSKAFERAKKSGASEFMYNGQRYSTASDMTPAQQMQAYGITDQQRITDPSFIRKNLGNLNTVRGYDIPLTTVAQTALGNIPAPNPETLGPVGVKEQDALRLYMGLPQQYGTFTPSRYKQNAYELTGYNNLLPDTLLSKEQIKKFGEPTRSQKDVKNPLKPYEDFIMGRHTVNQGKDERGDYLEYIDKWDLDSFGNIGVASDFFNKPYDIYGRKYYKDYGNGVKTTMYYTDNELHALNPEQKNFDTLALQKELLSRGYKLPDSTNKEGQLDGTFGPETQKALEDWQSKNFKPGQIYTYSEKPNTYYKYTPEGTMLIKHGGTDGKYVEMQDEEGKRLATLQKALLSGQVTPYKSKTTTTPTLSAENLGEAYMGGTQFADGGPLHDRDINGKLLNSTYASALGNMFREGGPFGEDQGAFDYAQSVYAPELGNYYPNGGKLLEQGQIYTYSDRPGSYYKMGENNTVLIKNESTGWKYVPIKDPTGERTQNLIAGLESGLTKPYQSQADLQYHNLNDTINRGTAAESTNVVSMNSLPMFNPMQLNYDVKYNQRVADQNKLVQAYSPEKPYAIVDKTADSIFYFNPNGSPIAGEAVITGASNNDIDRGLSMKDWMEKTGNTSHDAYFEYLKSIKAQTTPSGAYTLGSLRTNTAQDPSLIGSTINNLFRPERAEFIRDSRIKDYGEQQKMFTLVDAHGEGSSKAVHGTGNPERIEAFNTPGANRAMSNGCINVNGQTVCFDVLQKGSGMYILPEQSKQLVPPNSFFIPRTNSEGKPTIFKKGGMLKRADGSYSRRGLWDNIRAAAARNKLAGKSGKKPTSEMLAQEKKINNTYRTGGQFPRPYSLPEDSFKQGGRDLHNSVYASSNAQYPAVYNFGGTLKNNLATRQQMYMPLDHITRNGGSILSMSNTPELSGEGKDLTVPENSYYYTNGGSMEEPWLHNLYPNGGGLFQRWRNRNNPGITTNLT